VAAEDGLTNIKDLNKVEELHVSGNIFQDKKKIKKLNSLSLSCVESSRIYQKRDFYMKEKTFLQNRLLII